MSLAQIDDEDFRKLIATRGRDLLNAARYLCEHPTAKVALTRPLVGRLLSEAGQMEELLDAYRAGRNQVWFPLRSLTATIKQFSGISYIMLHIQHVLPSYRLLPIAQNLTEANTQALAFTGDVLHRAAELLMQQAFDHGLPHPPAKPEDVLFAEHLPPGRLPDNRKLVDSDRMTESVAETVTRLATAFLNLASESQLVHVASRTQPDQYGSCIPDPVSEMSLRQLKFRFHNLQALYDTHVTNTKVERLDPDLPVLRGHISVVYHLLEIATAFIHYYERHVGSRGHGDGEHDDRRMVDSDRLLNMLMQYAITFASQYITAAQSLCQTMLKRYAEIGKIVVSAPRYRGFHVRPSTLVAKIVCHYGSEVHMGLDGEIYDASTPLEIFRANEKINARKRRWMAEQIAKRPILHKCAADIDVQDLAMQIVQDLAQDGKVVIYEQPLQMPERCRQSDDDATLLECIVDEVARLQALGKIDIHTELAIDFVGDKRVLADIELLAACGYGEDIFGNNIALPAEIAYLRR